MPVRAYTAGHYAIEFDGKSVGAITTTAGGYATADVVSEQAGNGSVSKHIANVRYTDLEISCGAGTAPTLLGWLTDTLDGKFVRKDGAVVSLGIDYTVFDRLEFSQALLTEFGFPALDASSKAAAQLTARLTPESTRHATGKGKYSTTTDKQKAWTTANFRLGIDGLECTRVARIEPLVFRAGLDDPGAGEKRLRQKEPTGVEFPNLVVTLPASDVQTFAAWHESFVIQGNSSAANEKSGTLELLSPTMTPLFTLTFHGLGIFELAPVPTAAGAETVAKVTASMYCQQISIAVA